MNLDLVAEVADGPLTFGSAPDSALPNSVATIISTLATHACATECLGTAATITCGPCASSSASAF